MPVMVEERERVSRVGGMQFIKNPQDPLIKQLHQAVTATVSQLAERQNLSFDSLPRDEQIGLELRLLRESADLLSQERREVLLTRIPVGVDRRANPKPLEVNPDLIEITVRDQLGNEVGTPRLGLDRKIMLAFAVGLTQAKLNRFLIPWFTREELVQATEEIYSQKQLTHHLLDPLGKMGVFEKSLRWGYLLACNPGNISDILRADRSRHELTIFGFDHWRQREIGDTILFASYQTPLIGALYEQGANATSFDADIDVSKIRQLTGLSRQYTYTALRELEEQGIIERRSERFRIGDINTAYLARVMPRLRDPIVIQVRPKGVELRKPTIDAKHAEPLNTTTCETPVFPNVSWAQSRVNVAPNAQAESLSKFRAILTAKLSDHTVVSRTKEHVYEGRLPLLAGIDDAMVFGILDFLGLGPMELTKLCSLRGAGTIVGQLERLKHSNKLLDLLFLEAVKTRVASILPQGLGEKQVGSLNISQLVQLLPMPKRGITQPKLEETIFSLRAKGERPVIDRKLLAAMLDPFADEIRSAISRDSLPVGPLLPTQAMNFHRSLGNAANRERIPWRELIGLGLAYGQGKDHHPLLESVGALITAIYLHYLPGGSDPRGGRRVGLKRVTLHTAHLLTELSRTDGNRPEARYAKNCLDTLSRENLLCPCNQCRPNSQ